jgi:hypothetical protein
MLGDSGGIEAKLTELTVLQKKLLSQSGELDLSGRGIDSFERIEVPDITQTLILTDNNITSFVNFVPSPRLERLVLDGNPLLSFLGFPTNHSIREFSAHQTPLAELPNFTALAILVFDSADVTSGSANEGPALEVLNGRQLTSADRAAVSPQALSQHFVLPSTFNERLNPPDDILRGLTKSLGDILRRGWVSDLLPRNLKQAESEAVEIEGDPLSVRIVRLLNLIKGTAWTANRLLARVLAPQPERLPAKLFMGDPLLARCEQQQQLIFYLSSQVDDLKKPPEELSDETAQAYEAVLQEYGKDLVTNAACVREFSPARRQRDIRSELRRAVAKLVHCDPGVGDRELAKKLREIPRGRPST